MYKDYSQGRKILAPFGRILLAYQNDSVRLKNQIWIFAGQKSKEQSFYETSMGLLSSFLSHQDDFNHYIWPVKDQKIILQDTGGFEESYLKKFSLHLLDCGALCVFLYSTRFPSEAFTKKGVLYNE
jgi:hypothetical protein